MMDDDQPHQFIHADLPIHSLQDRSRLEYELTVRQEPKQARMCGVGGKADRRPIDPPPIVQLRVIDHAARDRDRERGGSSRDPSSPVTPPFSSNSFLQNPYYFMFASLAKPDEDVELHWLKDGKTRCTTGSVVSSLYHLKDTENHNEDAGFFVFPDLSVRTEGSYRLKLSLYEVVGNEVFHCKSVFSAPFYVYTAKKFPGMEESTPLSCSLADQGIKIRIRKDIRVRKRPMQVLEPASLSLSSAPASSGPPTLLPAPSGFPSSSGPPVRLDAAPGSGSGNGTAFPSSSGPPVRLDNQFAHFPSSSAPPVRLSSPTPPSGHHAFPSSSARPVRLPDRNEDDEEEEERERARERERERERDERERERERQRERERERERDDDRVNLRRTSGSYAPPPPIRRESSGMGSASRRDSGERRSSKRARADDGMGSGNVLGGPEVQEPSPISASSTQPANANWPIDPSVPTTAPPPPPQSAPGPPSNEHSAHYASHSAPPAGYDHRFQAPPPAYPQYDHPHHAPPATHYAPPPQHGAPHPYAHVPQTYYTHPPPPQWGPPHPSHHPAPPPQATYDPYMYSHHPPPPPHSQTHHPQYAHVPPPPPPGSYDYQAYRPPPPPPQQYGAPYYDHQPQHPPQQHVPPPAQPAHHYAPPPSPPSATASGGAGASGSMMYGGEYSAPNGADSRSASASQPPSRGYSYNAGPPPMPATSSSSSAMPPPPNGSHHHYGGAPHQFAHVPGVQLPPQPQPSAPSQSAYGTSNSSVNGMGGMGRSAPSHYQLTPAPQTSGHSGYPVPPESSPTSGGSSNGGWNTGQTWQGSSGHMMMQAEPSSAYPTGAGSYASSHHGHGQGSREGLGRIQLAPLRGQITPPPGGSGSSGDTERGKKSNNPLSIGNMVD
ncbi:unnamed protein product [Somion occarium]|uniref:Velvet domain-containing protein n=1 Tax=Somion occarium TaxID=3059160 RepID=A0ABP1CS65_9APHY